MSQIAAILLAYSLQRIQGYRISLATFNLYLLRANANYKNPKVGVGKL